MMYVELRILRRLPPLLLGVAGRGPGSSYLLLLFMLQVLICRLGVLLLAGAAALPCTTTPASCCCCCWGGCWVGCWVGARQLCLLGCWRCSVGCTAAAAGAAAAQHWYQGAVCTRALDAASCCSCLCCGWVLRVDQHMQRCGRTDRIDRQ
jgi:hypothetical protein